MVLRKVKSAFGVSFVENNWEDIDWENYQFNLKLMISVNGRAFDRLRRNLLQDEINFVNELEQKNQSIRSKYKVA